MKSIFTLSFLLLGILFLSSCGGTSTSNTTGSTTTNEAPSKPIDHLKLSTFKKLVDEKAGVLIDVRTPRENQAGSIAGTAHNIDVTNGNFKEEMGKLDKSKHYLIYCRSGSRSRRAMGIMESMGFKNIYDLSGGYMAWSKAGYK